MRMVRLPDYAPDLEASPGQAPGERFVVVQRPRPQNLEKALGRLWLAGWSGGFCRL
jgi:hypothetical protein